MLRLAIERPEHLDPALARSVPQSEMVVADLLFDGLTDLAEDWTADDELPVWTFRLRSDARFSDGRPVTAAAVVHTFDRVREEPSGLGSSLLEAVEAVTAPAADVVKITLRSPLATLPELLDSPLLGIVPTDSGPVGDESFDRAPVGSGPFALVERRRVGDVLRLEPGEGRDVRLDAIELRLYDDLEEASAAVEAGEADWSLVPDDQADRPGVEATPFSAQLFYGLNLASPALSDPRLREAIVLAVDREAVVAEAYGAAVVPTSSPTGGSDDPCTGGCDHDPARARRLVDQVYPEGGVPTVGVDFDEGERQRAVAAAIADDLRAVGVPVTLRPRAFSEYGRFVAGSDQEVFRLGWTALSTSPAAFLDPLFRSGSPENVMGLASDGVDAALDAAQAEADPEERAEKLAEAERLIMAEFPIVPLGQFQTLTRTSDRVHGLTMTLLGTFEDISQVWVEDGSANV